MTPIAYDLVAPATTYVLPVHPGDPPTYDGMTQREIHVNEVQYIACVSDFKNINQLEQQLTNLLLSAYDRKWLAVIMDPSQARSTDIYLSYSLSFTQNMDKSLQPH